MHIVQAAAFPFPSMQGSQVYVHGIARALVSLGHRVTVVCYGHSQGEVAPGIEVVRVPRLASYDRFRAGPDWVKPMLDIGLAVRLSQLRPDIVHVHNYEAPLAELIAQFRRKVPVIYSAHNLMADELEMYFNSTYSRIFARFAGRVLDRTIPRIADAAVAIRPETVSTLKSLGCTNVHCVMPGVNPQEFEGVSGAHLPPGPWIVYAGNPDAYQELDVLFDALQELPDDVGLLFITSALSFELKDLFQRKHILIKTSSFTEVCSYIKAADIAVLPRSVCSGFPIKLLNYLALAVPTIVAAGGAPELPGLHWFRAQDSVSLRQTLQRVLVDANAPQASARLRDHLFSNQNWKNQAALLESIYLDLLRSHSE